MCAPENQRSGAGNGRTPGEAPLSILVVHEMLPHPDRHGADVQWMQMLREFRAQGHEVVHVARGGVNRDRYTKIVEKLGIKTFTSDAERMRFLGYDLPVEWTFEQVLQEDNFGLAILFHWFWNGTSIPEHYMEEIRRVSPGTFIAVLTDDQQGLREMQMAKLTGQWSDYERSYDFTSREFQVYRRADLVLTISEDDRRALLRAAPELRTGRMPMIAEAEAKGGTFAERADLLFLANFDNLANRDAIDWMLAEIWPRIRTELPSAELALVGNNLSATLGLNCAGIRRVGYVADLNPVFASCRVAVSPVRFGTGIKTKNLSALAHGLPLVTTGVGADGMALRDNETALIADTPQDFADAVVRVYRDEKLWEKLSRQGRAHITEYFSGRAMQEAVRLAIEQARTIAPKRYEPEFVWPYMLVEQRFPEVLTGHPGMQRTSHRLTGYVNLADEFLNQGRPAEALGQLRHIFSVTRGRIPASSIYLHAVELMACCYRALGQHEIAGEYGERAKRFLFSADSEARPQRLPGVRNQAETRSGRIHFSVVIPTYNRQAVLAQCLEALGKQDIPADEFEVIVVDDGSCDATEEYCRSFHAAYAFRYLRQINAGAGAARRRGVQHSRGEYLLLMNDDTIACPDLLGEHWKAHQAHPQERQAVLGDFRFPPAAQSHALTRFLSESPFFFPQATLKAGKYWEQTYVVTCNLSVARKAVLAVGSFDAHFRVAEDSDLGFRLNRQGFYVRYVPQARAVHEHLPFTIQDLKRRAEMYGRTQLLLLRKHPAMLGEGGTFFGMLDEAAADKWRARVTERKQEVEDLAGTLSRIDAVDFAPFLSMQKGAGTVADEITKLFRRGVPEVYWQYFFSSLLKAWDEEAVHPSITSLQAATNQEGAYI
jgi:GT2 family glycosyltransferase/glycosyltransferase involved in cell wall biosynthesis